MEKKSYQKPEIKEVKLNIDDTLINACRSSSGSTRWARTGRRCNNCRGRYRAS